MGDFLQGEDLTTLSPLMADPSPASLAFPNTPRPLRAITSPLTILMVIRRSNSNDTWWPEVEMIPETESCVPGGLKPRLGGARWRKQAWFLSQSATLHIRPDLGSNLYLAFIC